MNYWYIAKPNELILDCDQPFDHKDARHICRIFAEHSVCAPKITGIYKSKSWGHYHVTVNVREESDFVFRAFISLALGSDRHREILALSQHARDWTNPYLVISPHRWPRRKPDLVCSCKTLPCRHLAEIQHGPNGKR